MCLIYALLFCLHKKVLVSLLFRGHDGSVGMFCAMGKHEEEYRNVSDGYESLRMSFLTPKTC